MGQGHEHFKCNCGMEFHSQTELMEHSSIAHKAKQEYKCSCGEAFGSQAELVNHANTMHKK